MGTRSAEGTEPKNVYLQRKTLTRCSNACARAIAAIVIGTRAQVVVEAVEEDERGWVAGGTLYFWVAPVLLQE